MRPCPSSFRWMRPSINPGARQVEATGASKAEARRRLMATVAEVLAASGSVYSRTTTFGDVAADRLASLAELVEAGRRSQRTVALYRHALDRHVLPGLGGLKLAEVTPARVDAFIRDRRKRTGYSVAKLCRSVASGVCGFAVRRDAMRSNPVRDVESLESPQTPEARALPDQEAAARWRSRIVMRSCAGATCLISSASCWVRVVGSGRRLR